MKLHILIASALMLGTGVAAAQDAGPNQQNQGAGGVEAGHAGVIGAGTACSDFMTLDQSAATAYIEGYQAGYEEALTRAHGITPAESAAAGGAAEAAQDSPNEAGMPDDGPMAEDDAAQAPVAADGAPAAGADAAVSQPSDGPMSPDNAAQAPLDGSTPGAGQNAGAEAGADAGMNAGGAGAMTGATFSGGALSLESILETCRQYPDNLLVDVIAQSRSASVDQDGAAAPTTP
ncbi:hypothetical protein EMQ25_10495 [Arsenicitalea aurantiaca]|uniref:Uncharacterized protein n=1 Tax=Arsenicitalea aurantiaca TaxID=1783274 RepID=A0A433XB26_9HYPH|nr:hypothetical protein [Arsenicitalea aurantiaca]RUT31279.1 hypothetical protein EMQ25_10495 [Arsenicitalea aurantiaca]